MHVTVEVKDANPEPAIAQVFEYFKKIDRRFSTYKDDSEISRFNRGEILEKDLSLEMREVFELAEKTKQETIGYFDIKKPDGTIDPSGLVKGWAIWRAAQLIGSQGYKYFFIDLGGDIQTQTPPGVQPWSVGIRNPFNKEEIIKILSVTHHGVATSGTYERGEHIYNPVNPSLKSDDIVSLTVIAQNIYEADRFATAAFAMGRAGIEFIEKQKRLEGYMVLKDKTALQTSGFQQFVA